MVERWRDVRKRGGFDEQGGSTWIYLLNKVRPWPFLLGLKQRLFGLESRAAMQVGILDVKCCPAPEARGGGRVCEKGRDVYVLMHHRGTYAASGQRG